MKIPKQQYTTEFKELALQQVRDGQSEGAVAKEPGLIEQTQRNGIKAAEAGMLKGAHVKVVTPEQMERSRLRAENVRLKRENEILKKRRRTVPGTLREVRLDGCAAQGRHTAREEYGTCCERKRLSRMEARRQARSQAADRRIDAGVDPSHSR